jgi:hypothetical protein
MTRITLVVVERPAAIISDGKRWHTALQIVNSCLLTMQLEKPQLANDFLRHQSFDFRAA